jgi:Ca-activated chloride channel family protein
VFFGDLSFARPWALALLALAPVAAWLFARAARKRREALRLFLGVPPKGRAEGRRTARAFLQALALALMVVALAGPRVGTTLQETRRGGLDLVVALDVSASMDARDVAPSRLERARFVLERLAEARAGDRLALVAFAGDAAILSPLTSDAAAFTLFLDAAGPAVVGTPGSDLARGLGVAAAAFEAEDAGRPRAVLLVTDGEDHEGAAAEAADALRRTGAEVLALAVGTRDGGPIPLPNGRTKRDAQGRIVITRLDPETLRGITGDVVEIEGDPVAALDARLDRLAEGAGAARVRVPAAAERFQWPLALALFFLVAERIGALMASRRSAVPV